MNTVLCLVCKEPMSIEPVTTRKGKDSLMLVCVKSGSHFRGFINDQKFIADFVERAKARRNGGPDS